MAYSYQSEVSDGTLQRMILSIPFYDKKDIHVYVEGLELSEEAGEYHWEGDVAVYLRDVVPAGESCSLRRMTDMSELRLKFSEGVAFTRNNLDDQNSQFLHMGQEAKESALSDIYGDVDMHRFRIRNASDPERDLDYTTKRWVDNTYAKAVSDCITSALSASNSAATATSSAESALDSAARAEAAAQSIDPQVRESLRRSYSEAGYNLVAGSFEDGGVITGPSDVLLQESSWKAYTGPAGTVKPGTDPSSAGFVDVSESGLFSALTHTLTVADMGLTQTQDLSDIKSTSYSNCVLDFGSTPLSLTRSLTLTLNNVLVVGLVVKPTTYTELSIRGSAYRFRYCDLSGVNAPKDYYDRTDTELPYFIALRLSGAGFSFKHNTLSEYVSRQAILVSHANDFNVSENRVINCWSYKRTNTGGTFDNYGDGIYVTDSINGVVKDNVVENSLGNPIGRIGVCVEFNCKNVKCSGNSIQGYDRGVHAELVEDDVAFISNNIRGCNFPLVAWNCKTAKVIFDGNTITTEGIQSGNVNHLPILKYNVRASIMSLGDYVEEYSNNSGVEFNNNIITTVDGTNTPDLIYSENSMDIKFKGNTHIRKNADYPAVVLAADAYPRTYFANLRNNKFHAFVKLYNMDVMDVRGNTFAKLAIYFKNNEFLTRGVEFREICDNTYSTWLTSGGVLMAGEAQTRFHGNTIIMGAFDFVFQNKSTHVVSGNTFIRDSANGFDPKLILASSRYAQGGNSVTLSGGENTFVDNTLKYSFSIMGSGRVMTGVYLSGAGMTKPPEFAVGGSVYDSRLNKPVFCKRRGYKTNNSWGATKSYNLGDVILVSGAVHQCIQSGRSAASSPAFSTAEGAVTQDGSVRWCSRGAEALWVDATGAAV